jgi:hypothetical protein
LWLDFSKEASSMGITKRMAVAVSGLVFTGAAALAVGAADSASAQGPVVAPQGGCRGGFSRGCSGSNRHHFRHFQNHHFRTHERVIVINRNNNFGQSDSGQHQRQQERQQFLPPPANGQ